MPLLNTPIVSIIVPCYNQAQYLPTALDSVERQSYSNWECIIVNDGSSDNTEDIALNYCHHDSRFIYLFHENQGLASSRNTGINVSSGEYILPLDADDYIGNTYLEKSIEIFQTEPDTKLVTCFGQHFGELNDVFATQKYKYEDFIWRHFLISCCAMYRKKDFDKTSGYNPNMKYGMEDFDFWLSLINSTDIVYQIPEVLFFYRIKKKSMNTQMQERLTESYSQLVLNHPEVYAPYFERLFNYPFLEYKIDKLQSSFSYKIGSILLKPAIIIREKFFRHKSQSHD